MDVKATADAVPAVATGMNTHDWLHNMPVADIESSCKVIEIRFNHGSRKDFFRNITLQHFEKGEWYL